MSEGKSGPTNQLWGSIAPIWLRKCEESVILDYQVKIHSEESSNILRMVLAFHLSPFIQISNHSAEMENRIIYFSKIFCKRQNQQPDHTQRGLYLGGSLFSQLNIYWFIIDFCFQTALQSLEFRFSWLTNLGG